MSRTSVLDRRALYLALDDLRNAHSLSWRAVAEASGVSSSAVFTRLRQGTAPDSDNLLRILAWLDADVRIFAVDAEQFETSSITEAELLAGRRQLI